MQEINIAPFYAGQRVVAIDALLGSRFINGKEYTVSACEYKQSLNPIANGKSFWYIGIVGCEGGGAYFRPGIFAPISEAFHEISYEKILEVESKLISSN